MDGSGSRDNSKGVISGTTNIQSRDGQEGKRHIRVGWEGGDEERVS